MSLANPSLCTRPVSYQLLQRFRLAVLPVRGDPNLVGQDAKLFHTCLYSGVHMPCCEGLPLKRDNGLTWCPSPANDGVSMYRCAFELVELLKDSTTVAYRDMREQKSVDVSRTFCGRARQNKWATVYRVLRSRIGARCYSAWNMGGARLRCCQGFTRLNLPAD